MRKPTSGNGYGHVVGRAAGHRRRPAVSGLVVLAVVCLPGGRAFGQMPGHGGHPMMPTQKLVLRCRLDVDGEQRVVEEVLEVPSALAPADLTQTLALPAPWPAVTATKFLPQATLRQQVEPAADGQGQPAMYLAIDGTKQHYQRWLVANDAERNRLLSLIGTWRYMAVREEADRDALVKQFEEELTRPPQLMIAARDGSWSHSYGIEPGTSHEVKEAGSVVRIKQFLPDFAVRSEGGEPISRSDQRYNPALLVEVQAGEKRVERWLFAKFGGFQMHESADLPFEARFDCPLAKKSNAPDFLVLTLLPERHEVCTRYEGKTRTTPLVPQKPVDVPGARYTFKMEQFVASGRLVETYETVEGGRGSPAVEIRTVDKDGQVVHVWLPLGKEQTLELAPGRLAVAVTLQQVTNEGRP